MTGLDNSEWVPMANPKNPEIYEFLDALYDVGRSERGILKRCQAAVNGTIYQDEAEDVMKSIMWGTIFSVITCYSNPNGISNGI